MTCIRLSVRPLVRFSVDVFALTRYSWSHKESGGFWTNYSNCSFLWGVFSTNILDTGQKVLLNPPCLHIWHENNVDENHCFYLRLTCLFKLRLRDNMWLATTPYSALFSFTIFIKHCRKYDEAMEIHISSQQRAVSQFDEAFCCDVSKYSYPRDLCLLFPSNVGHSVTLLSQ